MRSRHRDPATAALTSPWMAEVARARRRSPTVGSTPQISNGGLKYSTPVVEFGLPDDPNGTVAKGHVPSQALDGRSGLTADGTVTEVVVDDAGSGYTARRPSRSTTGPSTTRLSSRASARRP